MRSHFVDLYVNDIAGHCLSDEQHFAVHVCKTISFSCDSLDGHVGNIWFLLSAHIMIVYTIYIMLNRIYKESPISIHNIYTCIYEDEYGKEVSRQCLKMPILLMLTYASCNDYL